MLRAFAMEWTIPGTVLLAVVGARVVGPDHPGRKMRDFVVALAVVTLGMLLVAIADPDDGARPRYLSTTLLPVALLAGPGWDASMVALRTLLGDRLTRAAVVFSLLAAPVAVGAFLGRRLPDLWIRSGLYEQVERQHVERGVVVVRAQWPTRYARNGPFFDRPVLYISAPASMTVADVAALYPGMPVYEATEGRQWTVIERIRRD